MALHVLLRRAPRDTADPAAAIPAGITGVGGQASSRDPAPAAFRRALHAAAETRHRHHDLAGGVRLLHRVRHAAAHFPAGADTPEDRRPLATATAAVGELGPHAAGFRR